MSHPFQDFNFDSFWEQSEYATESYVGAKLTPKMIKDCENEIGYKLPESYIQLLDSQNGGIPNNTNMPTQDGATSWAQDHVALDGFFGCDASKTYSLCGELGGEFMKEIWEYPDIGVYICNCPSGGHDMIALDYRKNGKHGEPSVVHVNQELDYKITHLADDFETFIRSLVHDDVYDTSEEDLKKNLETIESGQFSSTLQGLIDQQKDYDFSAVIRGLCKKLTHHKGYFAFHDDELSCLMYDIQFFLMSTHHKIKDEEEYFARYPTMIAFGNGEFSTGGYAPNFIEEWMSERLSKNQITKENSLCGMSFSAEFTGQLLEQDIIKTNKYT